MEEGEVEEEVVDSDGCLPTTRVNGGVESVAKRVVVRANATSLRSKDRRLRRRPPRGERRIATPPPPVVEKKRLTETKREDRARDVVMIARVLAVGTRLGLITR